MAKRFTDTEKWKDEWWGSLSNDYRMIWLYLVDSCSIAGIWKKDFRGLNFNCNTKISEKEFIEVFGSRLIDRGNFFFIPKFLRFQCPKGLNSNKPAILSIVKEIEQNNLTLIIHQSFGNDFLIIKGKDKGTGKEEGKGTGQGMGEPEIVKTLEWFVSQIDEIYLENLKYTHKGKDIQQAIKEAYAHVASDSLRLKNMDGAGAKRLVNTWLTNTKSQNGKPKTKLLDLTNL
jgi:hypothetical protein